MSSLPVTSDVEAPPEALGAVPPADAPGDHPKGRSRLAEARRERSLLEATLDAIQEGVLVVDNDGKVVDYNDRFLEMWRIPEPLAQRGDDEALLAHVKDQLVDPEGFLERVQALYGDPDATCHDEVEFDDGRIFERHSRPHKLDGETVGRVWCFRDVTEQRRTRRRLEESNEQLENFASLVNHDLREPLRQISLYLDRLDSKLEGTADRGARESLEYAREGARRAQEMVQGLHRLAGLEGNPEQPELVDLDDVLSFVRSDLKEEIQATGATVETGGLPTVLGDRGQLTTLFQNLVKNALRYRGPQPPLVRVIARETGECFQIDVQDNGRGIPEDEQDGIFELFSTCGDEATGSGVGLAICRRIVEEHGGSLSVTSQPGKGSTFHLTFPSEDLPGSLSTIPEP